MYTRHARHRGANQPGRAIVLSAALGGPPVALLPARVPATRASGRQAIQAARDPGRPRLPRAARMAGGQAPGSAVRRLRLRPGGVARRASNGRASPRCPTPGKGLALRRPRAGARPIHRWATGGLAHIGGTHGQRALRCRAASARGTTVRQRALERGAPGPAQRHRYRDLRDADSAVERGVPRRWQRS